MNANIILNEGKTSFLPGEPIRGTVRWHLDDPVDDMELRLIYHTSGRGTQDVHTVAVEKFTRPGTSESRPFELVVDHRSGAHPWSFSGKLISVIWGLELVAGAATLAAECALTISPTGNEINIYAHDDGSAQADATRSFDALKQK